MALPKFDQEKEDIIKEVREMIHRDRDNGYILESLQSQYGEDFSDADLKKFIQEASN
ncbi:hypothetical protein [Lactobacillus hominis]|uniref:Uncharacterized protein n=1 Tax=Lactobacillus hominis DSM 23910 = CRBIP 24.179 TaxID=1423758 RepID=I7L4T8_9LACO|nr:hypothetical protein [Lactobacillus hominis]CCI80967.1 Putative uncharacterized protein [Lactobacillus hominis DSM 23910 = CRBIP 24.179]